MSVTKEYDQEIKDSVTMWKIPWPWYWLKAQWYAESLLQSDAKSSAGAMGICQFMKPTWEDVKLRLRHLVPVDATPYDARYAIIAGAYYMSVMRSGWSAHRSEEDRRALAQASYNAGPGHIYEAQKLTSPIANDYATIIAKLPEVTGVKNAKQTTDYVARIAKYAAQFESEEIRT